MTDKFYYHKVESCRANAAYDDDCICWHVQGTGIYAMCTPDNDSRLTWLAPAAVPAASKRVHQINTELVKSLSALSGEQVNDDLINRVTDTVQKILNEFEAETLNSTSE